MNKFVHADYKTYEVLRYFDSLISGGVIQSIGDLTYSTKCVIAGMLLKSEPITEILNFISQNGHEEQFKELLVLSLMRNGDKDFKEMIADYLQGYAVDYYEPIIESILNEKLDEIATY